jgi:uncharacterized membrane protein
MILVLLVAGAGELPIQAQDRASVTRVPECMVPAASVSSAAPPEAAVAAPSGVPPADPASPPAPQPAPTPSPTTTEPPAEPLRLYMPDGQLISHGLTVYVTTNLTATQKPLLRLFRSHAITEAGEDEDQSLTPVLVVPNQQWTETHLGRQVTSTGTILIFDTGSMTLAGRAMVRVRPLLYWNGGGCVLGPRDINVGDIRYAITWTVIAVVITLLMVLILARAKKENPMLLLTGVDGHLALSQAQIACWTIVVGGVVLGYGMIQREIPEIPASLIVLMGASLATGGVAYFQDVKKAAKRVAATGIGPAAREWRWGDLIRVFSPDRPPELSLSKAQMLFWTVLLLVLFVSKSILEGRIWEVPWPLVALMGFSQAGYLAPKVADTPPPPTIPAAAAPGASNPTPAAAP